MKTKLITQKMNVQCPYCDKWMVREINIINAIFKHVIDCPVYTNCLKCGHVFSYSVKVKSDKLLIGDVMFEDVKP